MAHERREAVRTWAPAAVVLALASSLAPAGDDRGLVDGSEFIRLAGDDAVTVEVSIKGALLKALTSADPELAKVAGGLESIHAVILDVERGDVAQRVVDRMRKVEEQLLSEGWERLARVKDEDSEVKVLVLNDEEAIHGLVVMVADDEELVFANISGILDLAAISAIGAGLDIPGLDDLKLEGKDDGTDGGD
jgi:hypothetical protein